MPDAGPQAESRVHRVDPRLVHATLLEAWIPHLATQHLVVADQAVARDGRRRLIFEMSARDVARTYFVDERDVASILRGISPDEPTMVVYGSLPGFHRALEAGLECRRLIVGHLPGEDGGHRVHPSVYVGPEDLVWLERIRSHGVDVVVQPLPCDRALGLRRGEDERPVLTEDIPVPAREEVAAPAEEGLREELAVLEEGPVSPERRHGWVDVINERGLHLRAAHLVAQRAGRFRSTIEVGWAGRLVNAKSLLGITTLGAARGTRLELRTQGVDADEAYASLAELFASGFEEGPP